MGYWAKDGSYVREDGDYPEAKDLDWRYQQQASEEFYERAEREKQAREEREKADRIYVQDQMKASLKESRLQEEERKNASRQDRLNRIHRWKNKSSFSSLMSKVSGKSKKVDAQYDQLRKDYREAALDHNSKKQDQILDQLEELVGYGRGR